MRLSTDMCSVVSKLLRPRVKSPTVGSSHKENARVVHGADEALVEKQERFRAEQLRLLAKGSFVASYYGSASYFNVKEEGRHYLDPPSPLYICTRVLELRNILMWRPRCLRAISCRADRHKSWHAIVQCNAVAVIVTPRDGLILLSIRHDFINANSLP